MKTALDLFCGGGLMTSGLTRAGFRVVGAVEFDEKIAECHHENFPGAECEVADVRTVDFSKWEGVSHVHGSPPCQFYSAANRREESKKARAPEAGLALEWVRAIAELRPRTISMEQVRGFYKVSERETAIWREVREKLFELGYALHAGVFDAADFGVPQHRSRFFVRGIRKEFLDEIPCYRQINPLFQTVELFFDDPRCQHRGWYGAVEDLLDGCEDSVLTDWQKRRIPDWLLEGRFEEHRLFDARNTGRKATLKKVEEPSFTLLASGISSHRARALLVNTGSLGFRKVSIVEEDSPSCTVTARSYRDKQNRAFLTMRTGATGSEQLMLRSDKEPSPTIRAMGYDGHWQRMNSIEAHPYRVKLLSSRCLARLQSVEDSFRLPGNDCLAGKIVGNGVPPLMAKRLLQIFA